MTLIFAENSSRQRDELSPCIARVLLRVMDYPYLRKPRDSDKRALTP